LGVQLRLVDVRDPAEFEKAFAAMGGEHAKALMVLPDIMFMVHRRRIVKLAAKSRLPAMYGLVEFVDAGGLMFYGASLPDMYARAASYVDRILKGAKPSELPIERPTKFELVINMKTAKALGVTIPQQILLRADRVIE
jgi:putative ABC transport system substrate-binding protein